MPNCLFCKSTYFQYLFLIADKLIADKPETSRAVNRIVGDLSATFSRLPLNTKGLIKRILAATPVRRFTQSAATLRRITIANQYLNGKGIEIGALHNPLPVSRKAEVQYVDRMTVAELKTQYPDLTDLELVAVDIIDDGEQLLTLGDETQDFVIANHFIEHCQNPILAIENMLRVLKPNGILYLGIPDKRYTFDLNRPLTTIDHLLKDYQDGPNWSRKQHFQDWAKYVCLKYIEDSKDIEDSRDGTNLVRVSTVDASTVEVSTIDQEAQRYMDMNYSIHFHVWTQTEILELLTTLKRSLGFPLEVELFTKNKDEMIVVLKKIT